MTQNSCSMHLTKMFCYCLHNKDNVKKIGFNELEVKM